MRVAALVLTVLVGMSQFLLAGFEEPPGPGTVPEPASLLLLAAGAGAVGLWRWRRSKNPK